MEWPTTTEILERVVLTGTALTAVWYGLKRLYVMARSVETLLTHAEKEVGQRQLFVDALTAHTTAEDERDKVRDEQLMRITSDLREITREIRPNGGTSIKDAVEATRRDAAEIKVRVAVLEEWKRAETAERAK